jgi:hypothetical protein
MQLRRARAHGGWRLARLAAKLAIRKSSLPSSWAQPTNPKWKSELAGLPPPGW